MRVFAALWASASMVGAWAEYSPEALKDEIHELPGAPVVPKPFRLFSGYIDVSDTTEKAGTRQMFYWFVESQNEPAKDPVLLWTNGGPGCSGLGGFLTEQGPFNVVKNGESLEYNEHSWTKVANMVFIEQPVGVGFSTVANKMNYNDAQAAADNHRFVKGFFKRYSQYVKQDLYISSESYGGHYMPTLAKKIKDEGDVPQFRGVFLGNPLTYMMYRNYGQYGTAWGHQLFPAPLWKRYEDAKCATTFPPSDACNAVTGDMDKIMAGFDPYALDFAQCNSAKAAVGRHERWALKSALAKADAAAKGEVLLQASAPYEPCGQEFAATYLNRADVRAAIHVKSDAKWELCSNSVGSAYNMTDVMSSMVPVWKELIAGGDLKIMIISGDDDSVCATLGTQQFVWDLGYAPKKNMNWQPWKVDEQPEYKVAGFRTDFDVPSSKKGTFSFVTVHSAGHMVPSTQPERSLTLVKNFLALGEKSETTVVV